MNKLKLMAAVLAVGMLASGCSGLPRASAQRDTALMKASGEMAVQVYRAGMQFGAQMQQAQMQAQVQAMEQAAAQTREEMKADAAANAARQPQEEAAPAR